MKWICTAAMTQLSFVVESCCQNLVNSRKKNHPNKSLYMQSDSPGSDILFICVRMDTSPFLLVTANTLQGGWRRFFSLSACDRQTFLLCGLLRSLTRCCTSSRPDTQSPCGHPLYIPFLCAPLVLSRKCLIYPYAILLSLWIFPLKPEWLQPSSYESFFVLCLCPSLFSPPLTADLESSQPA